MKKNKLIKITATIAVLSGFYITTVPFSYSHQILGHATAQAQEVARTNTQKKSADDLQKELSKGGKVKLEGTYALNGVNNISIPSNTHVDATGAKFIGSCFFATAFTSNITWTGGEFIQIAGMSAIAFQLWRSTDVEFSNMTFKHNSVGSHHFDLMGSQHIKIHDCTFEGYNLEVNEIPTDGNYKPHSFYAESIQVDYATSGGIGSQHQIDFIKNISDGKFNPADNAPTTDVVIENNKFLSLGSEKAQYPVGQHVIPKDERSIKNILVQNNVLAENVVPSVVMETNNKPSEPYFFRLKNGDTYQNENIVLKNNTRTNQTHGGDSAMNSDKDKPTRIEWASDGFEINAPTKEVSKLTFAWDKEPSRSYIEAHGMIIGKSPSKVDLTLNQPLAKGKKVQVPLTFDVKIFNAFSSYDFPTGTKPITGLTGETVSEDGSFSYKWDISKGVLTVTALDNSNRTNFNGLEFMGSLQTVQHNLIGLPGTPALDDGGDINNLYGNAGVGYTFKISSGTATSSVTLTKNKVTTTVSDFQPNTVVWSSHSYQDLRREMTSQNSTSGWYWSHYIVGQAMKYPNASLLDGSVEKVTVTPKKNMKNKIDPKNPAKTLELWLHPIIGTDSKTKQSTSIDDPKIVFADTSYMTKIVKNVHYDEKTNQLTFEVSRKKEDWIEFAKEYIKVRTLSDTPKIILDNIGRIASGNSIENVPLLNFNVWTTTYNYGVENTNFDGIIEYAQENSVTHQKSNETTIIHPYNSGEAIASKAGIRVNYVNTKGESIGQSSKTSYFDLASSWSMKPITIEGYKFISTNNKSILEKLGVTNVISDTGKVKEENLGKMYDVVHAYAQTAKVNIIYRDVDANLNVLATQALDGVMEEKFDNTTNYQKQLKELENKGFKLVKADKQTGTYSKPESTLYVDLKHDTEVKVNKAAKKMTQTVNFVDQKGKEVAPKNVQELSFDKTETLDKVTGQVLKTEWTDKTSQKITVKNPLGYHIDHINNKLKGTDTANQTVIVPTQNYTHNASDVISTVIFDGDEQNVIIHVIDVDGLDEENFDKGTLLNGFDSRLTGKSDASYDSEENYTALLEQLKDKGYVLIRSDEGSQKGKFDHDKNVDQEYNVYVKHGTEEKVSKAAKKVTQTVNFVDKDGQEVASKNIQELSFDKTETLDKITKQVLKTEWPEFQKTKAFELETPKGYIFDHIENELSDTQSNPDKVSLASQSYSNEDEDVVSTVVYDKVKEEMIPPSSNETENKQPKQSEKTTKNPKKSEKKQVVDIKKATSKLLPQTGEEKAIWSLAGLAMVLIAMAVWQRDKIKGFFNKKQK